ncbi:D-2-hydroxyacid dehydrogenase [Bosea sp. F3-2]|uniref:D-2-hydroxyacid dehydrogenase n=1 Tax=Bosea sp. F3-2 TaxID=2599640 RepID=UPI0011EF200E|nr:D-2-hydroxyacid dehydrogenase [Bosea sp. F3-2]QEL22908.1 D-2-hydroxyacid dehydrogenase [Bosea sp. F3-2]
MKVSYHASFPGFEPAIHCRVDGASFHTAKISSDLADLSHGSDALLILATDYTAEFAEIIRRPGSRLKLVQFLSAGFESAQLYGVPAGASVCNASDVWAPVVAEHAAALTLALVRRIPDLERRRQTRSWDRAAFNASLTSLDGANVAILGYGMIGQEIAKRLKPFGPRLIGISRSAKPAALLDEAISLDDLNDLLPHIDVLISVLPASASTRHFVDAPFLERMKPSAYFVNVGRGATVDETALVDALRDHRLGGAALDVFEQEPLPETSPLWAFENAILSPHAAGYGSPGIITRAHALCEDNLTALRDGQVLRSQVDLSGA